MLFTCPFDTEPAIWLSLFVSLLVSSILFFLSVLLLYYIFYWGLRWTGCCIMGPLHFLTIPFAPYCLSYCWKIQVIHHAWRSTWSQFPWYHDYYVTGIQLVVAFRLKEAKVITLLGPLASQVLMSSIFFLMLCFLAPFQQPPECGKGLGVNKGSGRSPEAADECLRWCQVCTWDFLLFYFIGCLIIFCIVCLTRKYLLFTVKIKEQIFLCKTNYTKLRKVGKREKRILVIFVTFSTHHNKLFQEKYKELNFFSAFIGKNNLFQLQYKYYQLCLTVSRYEKSSEGSLYPALPGGKKTDG